GWTPNQVGLPVFRAGHRIRWVFCVFRAGHRISSALYIEEEATQLNSTLHFTSLPRANSQLRYSTLCHNCDSASRQQGYNAITHITLPSAPDPIHPDGASRQQGYIAFTHITMASAVAPLHAHTFADKRHYFAVQSSFAVSSTSFLHSTRTLESTHRLPPTAAKTKQQYVSSKYLQKINSPTHPTIIPPPQRLLFIAAIHLPRCRSHSPLSYKMRTKHRSYHLLTHGGDSPAPTDQTTTTQKTPTSSSSSASDSATTNITA
ncbi:unnamed protein product, partial [Rodentolepis nana]|uniref:Secreted protein n=1 Tax=Rodentolepis nana TaxID=102285 RepID=A0A0R3TZV0_RODNA